MNLNEYADKIEKAALSVSDSRLFLMVPFSDRRFAMAMIVFAIDNRGGQDDHG